MTVYRVTETPATYVVEVLDADGKTWKAVTQPNQLRTGALRAFRTWAKEQKAKEKKS